MILQSVIFRSITKSATRSLSTNATIAVEKLRSAVEEYRKTNYAQELPSRCKKDIIKAADVDCTGQLRLEQLEMILSNIGASASISRNEIKTIFSEAGESGTNTIQADQMMKLL